MSRETGTRAAVFCGLVGLAVAVRLVTTVPNFGAVTAAALFAGFYFRHRTTAICVPLAVMTISDYFLGGYAMSVMIAVYGSMLLPIAWRGILRTNLSPASVGAGISSSLVYYLTTNAAVWQAWYPHDWQGLLRCYTVALPFLANAVTGDLLFAGGFFAAYAILARPDYAAANQPAAVTAAA